MSKSNAVDIDAKIAEMAYRISSMNLHEPIIVGIHTGGVWIAQKLNDILQYSRRIGTLDISFYRDDYSRVGLNPEVKSSEFHALIEDRNIILIDDVLYTGRTIRAAMNEIFSYGRPGTITLGVLVNRSGRELPIQADVVGCEMDLSDRRQVKLIGKNGKLKLKIENTGEGK